MPDVPDVYADAFTMSCSPYGVTMFFSALDETPSGAKEMSRHKVLVLRMSLEHAKAQAMIMHRHLKQFEEAVLKTAIPLPPEQPQP